MMTKLFLCLRKIAFHNNPSEDIYRKKEDYTLWACMAASRTGPVVFIDVVTPDRLYSAAHIQPNNSKMIAKATQEFHKAEKCDTL